MEILNRKARHDYFIEEEYECGIVLTGTEIKSIRDGKANIKDGYAIIRKNELFLLNMFISHYKEGNIFNHNETRTRKLLMHKKEILRISQRAKVQALTIIPLQMYMGNSGKVKVQIALAKGKRNFDKRESIKSKDIEMELRRFVKDK